MDIKYQTHNKIEVNTELECAYTASHQVADADAIQPLKLAVAFPSPLFSERVVVEPSQCAATDGYRQFEDLSSHVQSRHDLASTSIARSYYFVAPHSLTLTYYFGCC